MSFQFNHREKETYYKNNKRLITKNLKKFSMFLHTIPKIVLAIVTYSTALDLQGIRVAERTEQPYLKIHCLLLTLTYEKA